VGYQISQQYRRNAVQGEHGQQDPDGAVPLRRQLPAHDPRDGYRDDEDEHEVEQAVGNPQRPATDAVGVLEGPDLSHLFNRRVENKGGRVYGLNEGKEDDVNDAAVKGSLMKMLEKINQFRGWTLRLSYLAGLSKAFVGRDNLHLGLHLRINVQHFGSRRNLIRPNEVRNDWRLVTGAHVHAAWPGLGVRAHVVEELLPAVLDDKDVVNLRLVHSRDDVELSLDHVSGVVLCSCRGDDNLLATVRVLAILFAEAAVLYDRGIGRVEKRLEIGAGRGCVFVQEPVEEGGDDKGQGKDVKVRPPEPPQDGESLSKQDLDLSPERKHLARLHFKVCFRDRIVVLGLVHVRLIRDVEEHVFNLRAGNGNVRDARVCHLRRELSRGAGVRDRIHQTVLVPCRRILDAERGC